MTVQTDVDAEFSAYYNDLKAAQDAYFTSFGCYFQGMPTHTAIPEDGVASAPDNLSAKPSYQTEDWDDFGFTPGVTTKHRLRIERLETPDGHAWRAITEAYVAGALMQRTYSVDDNGTKTDGDWSQDDEVVDAGVGTTFTAYKIVPFNPGTEYLACSDDSSVRSNSVTIAAWIKNNTNDATSRVVAENWDTSGDAVFRFYYVNGKLVCSVSKTGSTTSANTRTLTTTSNCISASWALVAFTWDATGATAANALKIYLNGVNQSGTHAGTAALPFNFNPSTLNSENGLHIFSGFANGVEFGQFCRWNIALTAAELLELYTQGQSFDMQTNVGNYLRKNNVIQRYGFTSADSLDTSVSDTGIPDINDLAGSLTAKNYPSGTWAANELVLV